MSDDRLRLMKEEARQAVRQIQERERIFQEMSFEEKMGIMQMEADNEILQEEADEESQRIVDALELNRD